MTGKEPKEIKRIFDEVRKNTLCSAFRIHTDSSRKPGLTDSKFGGLPYWDKDKEYPLSEQGEKLWLLAQINLAQLPENDIFPGSGLLQFFISGDDLYGMDFDKADSQKNFRVVFHNEIKSGVTEDDIRAMEIPNSTEKPEDDLLPLEKEYSLEFEKTEISMGITDYRYENAFRTAAAGLGIELSEDDDLFDLLSEDEYNSQAFNEGHWLLGYPYFTQSDPREYEEELWKFDTMLLQIDSECGTDIMWGDMGVGNFYISKTALKNGDFSNVMYNWDCG